MYSAQRYSSVTSTRSVEDGPRGASERHDVSIPPDVCIENLLECLDARTPAVMPHFLLRLAKRAPLWHARPAAMR